MDGYSNSSLIEKIKSYTPKGYCQQGDIIVAKAEGSYFFDIEGKKYLDFTSGIFTNSFGHCFKPIIDIENKQINICDNIHGRRSIAELEFYQELQKFMPKKDYKFIPYNDGGYAVDRGLSDIINYYQKQRIPIGAFTGGFHGKTMATKLTINTTAQAALFENFQMDYPNCYRCPFQKQAKTCDMCCIKAVKEALNKKKAKAIIFELIQGAGIIIPPLNFWQEIAKYCEQNHIVMFADEVLTAGGRTGHFLASHGVYKISPDVISITKGLANGRPLSVLCEREYITDNPYAKRKSERSSTFASHPVNMAVATEVLKSLRQYDIFAHVKSLEEVLKGNLIKIKEDNPHVGDVRIIGLMAAIEFVNNKDNKVPNTDFGQKICRQLHHNGLEVIDSGHILRIAPPLNINKVDLEQGLTIIAQTIKQLEY